MASKLLGRLFALVPSANIIPLLLAAALAGAVMAGGILQLHISKVRAQHAVALGKLSAQHQAELATLRADHQKAVDKRTEEVRIEQETITTNYQKALNDSITRQTALQTERNRARAAADSLRHQARAAASRIRLPDTPANAVTEYALTQGELLTACGERYKELAGEADGHRLDVQTLRAAWPSLEPRP